MAVVGELIVKLSASTASFASDLGKARELSFATSKAMERSFKVIGAAAVAGLTTAATAITALALRSIDNADKMGKAAKAAGTTTEQFSALAYAAKLSNVPTEALSSSLVILAKNLNKASQATQEGRQAHSALTTLFKGNIPVFKDTGDAFVEISKRLDELPNKIQATALATGILGRSGALLLPMTQGLREAIIEARELGLVISDETAQKAAKFNDQITRIKATVEGFGVKLAEALLPKMTELANKFLDNAKNVAKFQENVQLAARTAEILARIVIGTAQAFKFEADWIAAAALSLEDWTNRSQAFVNPFLLNNDEFRLNLEVTKKAAAEARKAMNESGAAMKSTLSGIFNAPIQQAKTFEQIMQDTLDDLDKRERASAGIAIEENLKVRAMVDALHEQTVLLGLSTAEAAAFKVAIEQGRSIINARNDALAGGNTELQKEAFHWARLADAIKAAVGLMPKPKDLPTFKLNENGAPNIPQVLPDAFGQLTVDLATFDKELKAQADALNRENRPALEKYNEEMAKLRLLQDKFGLSTGAAAIEAAKLKEQLGGTQPVAIAVRQAMDEMLTRAIFDAKSFSGALGNVLQRIAEMIFQLKVLDPIMSKVFGVNEATGKSTGGGLLSGLFSAIGGLLGGIGSSPIGVVGAGTGVGGFGIPLIAGRASGGSVSGGMPYMVGEKGPEYFVPNVSGRIIPNGGMGAKASFVFNVDARGADAGIEQRVYKVLRDTAPVIVDNAVAKMIDLQRRTA